MKHPKQPDRELLMLRRLPAVVYIEGAAALLGWSVAVVALLTAKGYIKPLGNPKKANMRKMYSTQRLIALAQDEKALTRCMDFIYSHNTARNAKAALAKSEAADSAQDAA